MINIIFLYIIITAMSQNAVAQMIFNDDFDDLNKDDELKKLLSKILTMII